MLQFRQAWQLSEPLFALFSVSRLHGASGGVNLDFIGCNHGLFEDIPFQNLTQYASEGGM